MSQFTASHPTSCPNIQCLIPHVVADQWEGHTQYPPPILFREKNIIKTISSLHAIRYTQHASHKQTSCTSVSPACPTPINLNRASGFLCGLCALCG